jgi:integrase/recombinase XerD
MWAMGQAKTLSETQLQQLLDFIATQTFACRDRAMVLMTFWAGLRVGELALLRYGDVFDASHRAHPELRLHPSITKGRQARTAFLSEKLQAELNAYAGSHPSQSSEHALFYTRKNPERGFTPNTCAQHFLTLYRRAGISNASSHSGRRTFITTLANKGVSVRVLASLAGHRSIATTQRYIDVNDEMKRRAVEML